MQNDYAPILITVYNRSKHFEKCINSLLNNYGSSETDVYIALDYPYRQEDVEENEKVLAFCKKVEGFKSFTVIRREENIGAYKNLTLARDFLFEQNERLIVSEDDNIFSPYFLRYINEGLQKYQDDSGVFAICGYCPPIALDPNIDVFFTPDCMPYGFGMWRSKFKDVDLNSKTFFSFFGNPYVWFKYNNTMGDQHFISLLAAKLRGNIFTDVTIGLHKYQRKLVSLAPAQSLVRNIGQDGSGLNSNVNPELQNQTLWSKNCPVDVTKSNPTSTYFYEKNRVAFHKVSLLKKISVYGLFHAYRIFLFVTNLTKPIKND